MLERTFCGRNEICVENENVLENGILVGTEVLLETIFFVVVGDTIFAGDMALFTVYI